jgi:exopolysaccharide biosynthesis polyprenyl glycosylphosphotransferase
MNKKHEKIILFTTDFIFINLAGILYFLLRVQSGYFRFTIHPEFLPPLFVIYLYWLLIFTFVGMYRAWFAASRFDEISTLFKASFVGIFILFFAIYLDDSMHGVTSGSRILLFIYWGVFLLFVGGGRILIRSFQRKLLVKGIGRKNTLIVGYNKNAFEVCDQLFEYRALGLDVKAFVQTEKKKSPKEYKNVPVVGPVKNILSLIEELNIQEIIIALEKKDDDLLIELISLASGKDIGLKIVPNLYEILSGQARSSQIYGMPLIDLVPQLMPEWERKLKRLLDIMISFIILIVSLPLSLMVAIAIKIDSPGTIFFIQQRCGLNDSVFRMIKFRSMFKDAEKHSGPVWSQKDDPRVTRVGKILRKLRLDEIPQMYNVLKGEMSLVGPRPERPFFVEKFAKEIPYYKRRLKVRPGITGWAQVKHKYDESIEDVKAKLRFDLFYIENMSINMDFKILFRTIFVVVFGKGHFEK